MLRYLRLIRASESRFGHGTGPPIQVKQNPELSSYLLCYIRDAGHDVKRIYSTHSTTAWRLGEVMCRGQQKAAWPRQRVLVPADDFGSWMRRPPGGSWTAKIRRTRCRVMRAYMALARHARTAPELVESGESILVSAGPMNVANLLVAYPRPSEDTASGQA